MIKNDVTVSRRIWLNLFFGRPFGLITDQCGKMIFCALTALVLSTSTSLAQEAYAMEFNQGNNLFGQVNLLNGSFTQLGSEGSTLFNDVADAPNGTLYGIVNSTSLVTLNTANGS